MPAELPSAIGELTAQSRRDLLTLAREPDHNEVVAALEPAPRQGNLAACQTFRPGMPGASSGLGDPMPGLRSIWSSAASVALTNLAGGLAPVSWR